MVLEPQFCVACLVLQMGKIRKRVGLGIMLDWGLFGVNFWVILAKTFCFGFGSNLSVLARVRTTCSTHSFSHICPELSGNANIRDGNHLRVMASQ